MNRQVLGINHKFSKIRIAGCRGVFEKILIGRLANRFGISEVTIIATNFRVTLRNHRLKCLAELIMNAKQFINIFLPVMIIPNRSSRE